MSTATTGNHFSNSVSAVELPLSKWLLVNTISRLANLGIDPEKPSAAFTAEEQGRFARLKQVTFFAF
jgi:hypothetical protein